MGRRWLIKACAFGSHHFRSSLGSGMGCLGVPRSWSFIDYMVNLSLGRKIINISARSKLVLSCGERYVFFIGVKKRENRCEWAIFAHSSVFMCIYLLWILKDHCFLNGCFKCLWWSEDGHARRYIEGDWGMKYRLIYTIWHIYICW